MKNNLSVDRLAKKLSNKNKTNYLSSFFKKQILKKFKNLQIGYIELKEKEDLYFFGDSSSKVKVRVSILSSEFYILLGSAGVLGAAEAYVAGCWKSDNLVGLIRIILQNKHLMSNLESGWSVIFKPINNFIHWSRKNSLSGSKKNIIAHYDLSNDFYKLWLDQTMTYSCAIFNNKSTSLKEASIEKIDRICRKIKLNAKDSILEIGTGWGSFSLYVAKKYGCHITTTTISDAQYDYVMQKIKEENLLDRITLLKSDYRNLEGKFDKIVSIEMIEAVGHQYVPIYFNKVSSLLVEDGLFALQTITFNDQNFDIYKNSVDFIKKYIFPGSCLTSILQIVSTMKKYTDFSISHIEDITFHYARTLKIWRENFINRKISIRKLGFSDELINIWEFYFVYCEAGFRERNIGDYQIIFSKPGCDKIDINY